MPNAHSAVIAARKFVSKLYQFKLHIRKYNSYLNDIVLTMANYSLNFMGIVEVMIMNIHSLKIRDWSEFSEFIQLMIQWARIHGGKSLYMC